MSTTRNFSIKTATSYSFDATLVKELFLILFVATLSFAVWTALGGEA